MAAPRALTLVIVVALAACTTAPTVAPSPSGPPSAPSTAEPSSTGLPEPTSTPVPLPQVTPAIDDNLAGALKIASPFDFEPPSSSDIDRLSGNILGLPSDLAATAGAGYAPPDFPMGYRFVLDGEQLVGVIAVIRMPAEVAEQPGLLDSIVAAVALEVNAIQAPTYETVEGVRVGVVRGPIANTLAIVHGHLVVAQSGQPAVDPRDLMAAVITANNGGFAGATPTE